MKITQLSYTKLKDEEGNQRQYFLGHVLDNNKKIIKSYVCGIENNTPFCLEGYNGRNEELYEARKVILKQFYAD